MDTTLRCSKRSALRGGLALLTTFGLLALSTPVTALAQQAGTGSVGGLVTDERGEPVAGAQMTLVESGRGALTRPDGRFLIENVPPGTYTLRVTAIGYSGQDQSVSVQSGVITVDLIFGLALDPLNLEGVVVTATRSPVAKLESSTAVTTLPIDEIENNAPRSTADLMKQVPGFYAEASGGNVNNNLFVRGLPQDGSYRYVVVMEDGMPANDANDLFFLGADNFIRLDLNVDRVEAVRGGNSALYGSNSPGGVVNLINKTGGPTLSSGLRAAVGTDGFTRYDANLNGPLTEDWRFSVGGYYQFDSGIRDPGFPSVNGGILKANITRLFEQGYLTVSGKYINDSNIFYLPLPLEPGTASGGVVTLEPNFVPGFPQNGTMTGRDATQRIIPLPQQNGELLLPLDKGIAQTGATFTADFGITFPFGWSLRNTARVMNLNHQWNAVLPFEIQDATTYLDGQKQDPTDTAELTFTDTGDPFNTANNLVSVGGLWHVEKPVTNFSYQLLLSRRLESQTGLVNDITVGGYFGHYTADNIWYFNDILTNVQTQPLMLNQTIRDASGGLVSASQNGFTRYLSNYVNGQGNATLWSVFAGDEIEFGRWRIDLGARFERDVYEQNVEGTSSFDLGDTTTTADDDMIFGDRTFTRVDTDFNEWAASLAALYGLTENISLYARGSRGYKMPLLDQFLFSSPADFDKAETIYQVEGGVKVGSPVLGLSAVAYWLQIEDFPSQDAQVVDGQTQFVTALVGKSRTIGAEIEAVVVPVEGLRLVGITTLQDPEYTNFIEGEENFNGNWVRRIPKVIFELGGVYNIKGVTLAGDWIYTGKRFSNNANTIELPAFSVVSGRLAYAFRGQGIEVSVLAQNLLDGAGLTEGNPRVDESGIPIGPALARPILPQRFVFAVRWGM